MTLSRAPRSYPAFFKDLLDPAEAVVPQSFQTHVTNKTCGLQSESRKNIEEEELDPDDILIVLAGPTPFHKRATIMNSVATSMRMASPPITPDIPMTRFAFMQSGSITVSGIFRAKGNEAPMVYIANADFFASGHEMIRFRNILFTAITRSRGWVRVCGTGLRDDGSSEGNRPGRQERLQTQISNSDTIRVGKDATHQPRPYCSREGADSQSGEKSGRGHRTCSTGNHFAGRYAAASRTAPCREGRWEWR